MKFFSWELQGKIISDCQNKLFFPEAEKEALRIEEIEQQTKHIDL